MLHLRKKNNEVFGFTSELPEGIFGLLDRSATPKDLLKVALSLKQARQKNSIKDTSTVEVKLPIADRQVEPKLSTLDKVATSSKEKVFISLPEERDYVKPEPELDLKTPSLQINKETYDLQLPDLPFENTVKVSESTLKKISSDTDRHSSTISKLILDRMLPALLGFDSAQAYVESVMKDGFSTEIEVDTSVLEIARSLTSLSMANYFVKHAALPKNLKNLYMRKLVIKSADSAVLAMQEVGAKKERTSKRTADLRTIISRGMSGGSKLGGTGENPESKLYEDNLRDLAQAHLRSGRLGKPPLDPRESLLPNNLKIGALRKARR